MRNIALLAFATTLACNGDGPETDDGDTNDADADTDTDSDTDADSDADSDTDTDTETEVDPDFAANGPGVGYVWFLEPAPQDAPMTNCGVGSANSLNFYSDTWQVQSVLPSSSEFGLAVQATPIGSLQCTYEPDGAFTCAPNTYRMDLHALPEPYTMDAVVTMITTVSGRFGERVDVDPATNEPHTFSARWAADMDLIFSADCTGSECSWAAQGMGAGSLPCTSTFTDLAGVNYSDPTLSDPM